MTSGPGHRPRTADPAAPTSGSLPSGAARAVLTAVALVAGLYLTWQVAQWAAWQRSGLDRDVAEGSADCDHCGLTVPLDHLGTVLACFGAYAVLVVAVAWLRRRRRAASTGS